MGQSLVQNYQHIIFQTKNHVPLILPKYEDDLYEYLGGICRQLNSPSLKVGGYLDHVHLLCRLSKNLSITQFVQKVKSSSSKWYKSKSTDLSNFYWQDGYGSFSVSQSQVVSLTKYIENQYEHHQKQTFKEEYIELLEKYDLEFNLDFLWT